MTALITLLTVVVILMVYLAVYNSRQFKILSIIILVLIISVSGFLVSLYLNEKNIRHETGRDTVAVYGDGTFQIIGRKPSHLADLERDATLEESIIGYKLVGDSLFVAGKRGYTIVNIKSENIKQYVVQLENKNWDRINIPKYGERYIRLDRFEGFSPKEQEIFNNMNL